MWPIWQNSPARLLRCFEPPFTTVHVGIISGGTAHNITAKDCHFDLDFRAVPDENLEDWCDAYRARVAEIETQMQAIIPDTGIDIVRYFGIPGLKAETDGAAEAIARAITGDNAQHTVSYGTEAGQFQERGYSAVVCGPGNIEQAHQPNEFISIEQFEAGQKFVNKLVQMLAE